MSPPFSATDPAPAAPTPPPDVPGPDLANLGVSVERMVVPLVVGAVAGWLVQHHLGVPVPLVTTVVTFLYYLIARTLEHFVSAKFGWLLGNPKAPHY